MIIDTDNNERKEVNMKKKLEAKMSNEFGFEFDGHEVSTSLILEAFGKEKVRVTYLEIDEIDEIDETRFRYFLDSQEQFYNEAMLAIKNYAAETYNSYEHTSKLLTLYIYDEIDRGYGLLFSSDLDEEHGIGVIFERLNLVEVGHADISFTYREWEE